MKLIVLILGLSFLSGAFAQSLCPENMFIYECMKKTSDGKCQVGNGTPRDWKDSPCEKLFEQGSGLNTSQLSEAACVNIGATYSPVQGRCMWEAGTKNFEQYVDSKVQQKIEEELPNLIDNSAPSCPVGGIYNLAIVNGKITLECAAPPACTECASWGAWQKVFAPSGQPVCDGGHAGWGGQGYRVNCHYQRVCITKLPQGCVGSVPWSGEKKWVVGENYGKYEWCNADTCGKWSKGSNCGEEGPPRCPNTPWF